MGSNRNAYTGKIIDVIEHPSGSSTDQRGAIRARRTRLQQALLAQVPDGIIRYNKKLIRLDNLQGDRVKLVFQDSTEVFADIVVGADGIHSVSPLCTHKTKVRAYYEVSLKTDCSKMFVPRPQA